MCNIRIKKGMKSLKQILLQIRKNIHLFLSVLLLTTTIGIFGPIELYFTNCEEFWFAGSDVVLVAAILTGVCVLVFIVIGLLLRGKAREVYSSIIFALGLALYIQGNYANINYGVLNGESVDWGAYPVYAILDTVGWLVLIIAIVLLWFYKRKLYYKMQIIGALWIIAIQIVTLVILLITTDVGKIEKSDYYLSNEGMYEVSSDENIIIFVLDGFDSSDFQEIMEEDSQKYQAVFEDFTFFNNAAAVGCPTKLGMPSIITGEPYPGDLSYIDYIRQTFDNDKLYTTLQEKNYDVRIFTNSTFIPDESSHLINNQVSTGYSVSSYPKLTQKYATLTLYKYMPHIMKKFFWIYTGEFDDFKSGNSAEEYGINDVAYFEVLKEDGLSVKQGKNVFRLFHLNGAHAPYRLDEYAKLVDSEDTSRVQQAKGALYIVENYISQLKELGLYDTSTIVIMADHGSEHVSTLGAHGLLLAKEKGHKGAYVESGTPVSYGDLHATILGVLGMPNKVSFWEIPETARRRYFYQNDIAAETIGAIEFVIDGNLNDENVIKPSGTILQQSADTEEQYVYGTELAFGGDNSVHKYVCKGISFLEGVDSLWTDGKECEFRFELETIPKKNLLVTVDILNTYSENGPQAVIVYANDIECYRKTISGSTQLQFVVPGSAISNDKELRLRMELPNAVSPAELFGAGYDGRVLALALQRLQIDETGEDYNYVSLEPIDYYVFGEEGNIDNYLLAGWYTAETNQRWASAKAELLCKTVEHCDYQLELQYACYAPSGKTNIYVNDVLLTTLDEHETTTTVEIPTDVLKADGNQTITFETPGAISPKNAGENADERVLGICVYSMKLYPIK